MNFLETVIAMNFTNASQVVLERKLPTNAMKTRTNSDPVSPPPLSIFKGSGNIVIVWVRLGSWH